MFNTLLNDNVLCIMRIIRNTHIIKQLKNYLINILTLIENIVYEWVVNDD